MENMGFNLGGGGSGGSSLSKTCLHLRSRVEARNGTDRTHRTDGTDGLYPTSQVIRMSVDRDEDDGEKACKNGRLEV